MKTHSFKRVEYKCEECDFGGENELTMEVHVGRKHCETFDFGLCDFVARNLESLDIHLNTYEIYECDPCYEKLKTLADLKKHKLNGHEEGGSLMITYAKIDRNNSEEIK